MGVAVRVRQSTEVLSCFRRSLCFTPKRCSSSTTSSPRFLNFTSFWISRCVPITMSTCPAARPRITALHAPPAVRKRESISIFTGKPREALLEGLEVLLHQDRGGRQQGHLLAAHHRLEGGAQGDLGLAVAHVPADQAVHGPRALHVPLHLLDARAAGPRSPGRGSAASNSLCQSVSGAKAKPGPALRREYSASRRLGQVLHRPSRPSPSCSASPCRPGVSSLGLPALLADVALDQVHLLDGHEQLLPVAYSRLM